MGDAGADKHCGIDRSYEEPMPMPLTSRAAQGLGVPESASRRSYDRDGREPVPRENL